MKKTKIFLPMMALALVFGLAACNQKQSNASSTGGSNVNSNSSPASSQTSRPVLPTLVVAGAGGKTSINTQETLQLSVTANGEAVTGVSYELDKENVVEVSETGLVTPTGFGEVTITVSKSGYNDGEITITVTEVLLPGELRSEAEQAAEVLDGTTHFMNLTDSTQGITRAHSGGGYISGYQVQTGDTLTLKFDVETAQTMTLAAVASPAYQQEGDYVFATNSSMKFNDDDLTLDPEAKISAGTGGMSQPTEIATLCDVTTKAGENTLVVTFNVDKAPSFDYFRLLPKQAA